MKSSTKPRHKTRTRQRRQGAATIELAVCLPMLILLCFGSIQAASMMFLRQALVQSAYEGAKVAARDEGTNAGAIDAINAVAAGRNIQGLQITFTPSDITSVPDGDLIRVTVTAPSDPNSLFPIAPFQGVTLGAEAVMAKE